MKVAVAALAGVVCCCLCFRKSFVYTAGNQTRESWHLTPEGYVNKGMPRVVYSAGNQTRESWHLTPEGYVNKGMPRVVCVKPKNSGFLNVKSLLINGAIITRMVNIAGLSIVKSVGNSRQGVRLRECVCLLGVFTGSVVVSSPTTPDNLDFSSRDEPKKAILQGCFAQQDAADENSLCLYPQTAPLCVTKVVSPSNTECKRAPRPRSDEPTTPRNVPVIPRESVHNQQQGIARQQESITPLPQPSIVKEAATCSDREGHETQCLNAPTLHASGARHATIDEMFDAACVIKVAIKRVKQVLLGMVEESSLFPFEENYAVLVSNDKSEIVFWSPCTLLRDVMDGCGSKDENIKHIDVKLNSKRSSANSIYSFSNVSDEKSPAVLVSPKCDEKKSQFSPFTVRFYDWSNEDVLQPYLESAEYTRINASMLQRD